LGGAIFVAVLTVHASLCQTLNDALNYWRYDVQISFGRTYRTGQLIRVAQQTPGAAQAECWTGFGARRIRPDGREGDNFELLALPVPSDFISPYLVQGRWLLPGDENALVLNTDVLKTEKEVRVGDSVTLKINGKESNWRVVGIVRGIMMGSVGYANYSYVTRITGRVGVAGQVLIMGMQHDTQSQIQLANRLEVAFKAAGYQVRSTETITDIRSRAQSQFNILVIFLLIMAVLLAVVGGLGLMGTMSINVLERTREIGVMRAIGASNWGMMQVFLVEGIFIGLLSWLLGAFLSIPLSRMLTQIVGDSMLRAPLSYRFSFIGLALWLIIVGVLAALASVLPAWKAARLTVRDVLAYE
jgi:putative ABC transport system permease protein